MSGKYSLSILPFGFIPLLLPTLVAAHGTLIEEVTVVGERSIARQDASSGSVTADELDQQPRLRTGDILEAIPGLIATQHSGSGKANQYFLRGFNLDHGTDFSTRIDFMPVNMRSHGHGQGYSDLNFIIPELIERIDYRKGAYYVDSGDFTGTGSAHLHSATVKSDLAEIELGQYGYGRTVLAHTVDIAQSQLLIGAEYQVYDGSWDNLEEDVGKKNLWLKYSNGTQNEGTDLTLMAYQNEWNSPDQIPGRAVESGLITSLGSLDTSAGGESERYSLSGQKRWTQGDNQFLVSGYGIHYKLDLWSNFTYFTKPEGDQFQQSDERNIYGWDLSWSRSQEWLGRPVAHTLGSQWRFDDIGRLGLFNTQQRQLLDIVRQDAVQESSQALYWQSAWQLTEKLRSVTGLRYDRFRFALDAQAAADMGTLEANSGAKTDGIVSGAQKFVYAISPAVETYASIGRGFHSNDTRGVLLNQDPVTGEASTSADPLVPLLGYEAGFHFGEATSPWSGSIALWHLAIDSELLFVGDAGITEDTGVGSTRQGIEMTSQVNLTDAFRWELEYAYSDAKLDDAQDGLDSIPGALKHTLVNQLVYTPNKDWQFAVRYRYFGEYPLDGGATAPSSSLVNARAQYTWNQHQFRLDVINLLDSDDHDVEYYYESQLQSETEPQEDHHYHVFEPRSVRVAWRMNF